MISIVLDHGVKHSGKRECGDCAFCKAAVSWWCQNKEACKERGSSIPFVHSCKFWEPCEALDDMTKKQQKQTKCNLNCLIVGPLK